MLWQLVVVDAIARNVDFFWTPEERTVASRSAFRRSQIFVGRNEQRLLIDLGTLVLLVGRSLFRVKSTVSHDALIPFILFILEISASLTASIRPNQIVDYVIGPNCLVA